MRGAALGPVLAVIFASMLVQGCATRAYRSWSLDDVAFRERAKTQRTGDVRVTVAVPSAEEARRIFGIPVYDRHIQPVWIEIENGGAERLRFAPVGVDRSYFAPLEVAYMFRGGYSKQARGEMDARIHELAMARRIGAGETKSGFVFTHVSPGTKAVNVDLFGAGDHNFTFFVEVPGFVPDHAELDLDALYEPKEVRDLDLDGLRRALAEGQCCATGPGGEGAGLPVNVVLVADEEDGLHALLRAGWYETRRPQTPEEIAVSQHLYGRPPDAVFRLRRSGSGRTGDRNELRIWMAPLRAEGKSVWMAQISHYIGRSTTIERALFDSRLDPDIDDARDFMLQVMWYGQGLEGRAWLASSPVVEADAMQREFSGALYFTNGLSVVLWLSGTPMSLVDGELIDWDDPFARGVRREQEVRTKR